jgi:hypothetical protein
MRVLLMVLASAAVFAEGGTNQKMTLSVWDDFSFETDANMITLIMMVEDEMPRGGLVMISMSLHKVSDYEGKEGRY